MPHPDEPPTTVTITVPLPPDARLGDAATAMAMREAAGLLDKLDVRTATTDVQREADSAALIVTALVL